LLRWIHLRTVGGLIKQHHIIRHDQLISTVEARIVSLNNMEIGGILLRKIIEKLLKIVGINAVIRLNHALTRQRFYHPVQREGFKQPLHFDQGFNFFQGQPPARDRL